MPSKLAVVGDEVVGYTMPFVPNINFQEVLESKDFTHDEKVSYLKEIGLILEKLRKVRKYSAVGDLYLNDMHENNFILNTETGKINVVDLDSAKIGYNLPSASRYLSFFSQIRNIPKYKEAIETVGGDFIPDENTDIYCYIVMIFNYFYGSNIGNMSISDFYIYLEYLQNIGVSKEFLDAVGTIYTPKDNINPYELLDAIKPFYGRSNEHTFKLIRKKGRFGL